MKLHETKAWIEYRDTKYSNQEWDASPHAMIKRIGPGAVGKFGEELIADIFSNMGFIIEKRKGTEFDLLIDGLKAEIKTATRSGPNKYIINQIRPAQDYDVIIMLLIDPHGYRVFKARKEDYSKADQVAGLKYQHGGKDGKGNTLMLNVTDTPAGATLVTQVNYEAFKL